MQLIAATNIADRTNELWSLQWCHFYGSKMGAIYRKYQERGGRPVFQMSLLNSYHDILDELYTTAASPGYVRNNAHPWIAIQSADESGAGHMGQAATPFTDKTVVMLAVELQIESAYLSRLFKKVEGVSSTQFRMYTELIKRNFC